MRHKRPSWDEYYLGMLIGISARATCDRGRSACLIVVDNGVATTGYVGAPEGCPHCDDVGHLMEHRHNHDGTESDHCIRTVHAERNSILRAAKKGIRIEGGTMYCTMVPCYVCAQDIIQAGIKRVVAIRDYQRSQGSKILFSYAKIKLDIINPEIQTYGDTSCQNQKNTGVRFVHKLSKVLKLWKDTWMTSIQVLSQKG